MDAAARETPAPMRVESLIGPFGAGASHTGWDSATLNLHSDGTFVLELWHFYESWDYLPDDDGALSSNAGQERPEVTAHIQRAMHPREVEEVRVSLRGTFVASEAFSLRLGGLHRAELNQEYVEDKNRKIGGLPSWWSEDGRSFLYFANKCRRWKANAVKLAGGDGVSAVEPGRRKAGAGYAQSGPVEEAGDIANALTCADGWCDLLDGEWQPAQVQVKEVKAKEFRFFAKEVVVEERHVRGGEGSVEDWQVSGPVTFCGWRHVSGKGELRLAMPRLPERHEAGAGEIQSLAATSSARSQTSTNFVGDPCIIIFRPCAKL